MFGQEINAFISLDLIFTHYCDPEDGSNYLNNDVFKIIRQMLHNYFFGDEKAVLQKGLAEDLKNRWEEVDTLDRKYNKLQSRLWILPLRLSFKNKINEYKEKGALGKYHQPSPIKNIHPDYYFISGVKIYSYGVPGMGYGEMATDGYGFCQGSRIGYVSKKKIQNRDNHIKHLKKWGRKWDMVEGWEKLCIREDMDEEEKIIKS